MNKELIKKYLADECSAVELEEIARFLKRRDAAAFLQQVLDEEWNAFEAVEPDKQVLESYRLRFLENHKTGGVSRKYDRAFEMIQEKKSRTPVWIKYAAAAILLLTASSIVYFNHRSPEQQLTKIKTIKYDAQPGSNKAILTLANGLTIALDNERNGTIARQGHTRISKVKDGRLVYQPTDSTRQLSEQHQQVPQTMAWNTISTPKGGQYTVVLPDGSNIWLNAASSIAFPTVFTGNERKVKITGEVYLEVAKNAAMPFLVETKGQMIRVLGTHFNVNAYDDEQAVKTTLLEGRIQLTTNNHSKILMPGQQATVDNNQIMIMDDIDTEAAVAWKNGYFIFDHTDLPSLMRQLSRWYDVHIIYNGTIRQRGFIGQISRQTNLSNVLKILALSGVHFKIEDKMLYIQP